MFKVGDKVRAFGVDGVVTNIHNRSTYPVIVDFGDNCSCTFRLDGKYSAWHKEPTLVLVERAEKFEEVVGYVAVFDESHGDYGRYLGTTIHKTKEEAMEHEEAIGYQEVKYFRKVK